MSLEHLPGFALPASHPLAGREAFQCDKCGGISYPPKADKCPYCESEGEDSNDD